MTGRKVIKESTLSSLYECDFEIKFFIKQINEDSTKMVSALSSYDTSDITALTQANSTT